MSVIFTFLLNVIAQIVASLFTDLIKKFSWKKKERRFSPNRLSRKK
jgi:hypothetical protein